MKLIFILALLSLAFFACENKANTDLTDKSLMKTEIVKQEFQSILDSVDLEGSILIYDLQKKIYFSNDFEWAKKGKLPASTFKIAHSLIALETKVVEDDQTLFRWDGEERALKSWEQDLIFRDAFHFSCVPCFQQVARKIGLQRMTEYLRKFNYGSIELDSTNIDLFWLEGDSRINQIEQIDFLLSFYKSELPISERSRKIMRQVMVMEENKDYKLSGKTGWSTQNGINNGWFVGYIESGNRIYFFATNVEPKAAFSMERFPMIRKEVTILALKQIEALKTIFRN